MSGVMPIIFSNSIVAIPATIVMLFDSDMSAGISRFIDKFFNTTSWAYLVVFLVLLIAFAFFYIAISFNPVEVANNIKNNGGAIPGIRSGRPTVEFIKKVLGRITLIGALLIAVVAGFPMIVNNIAAMLGDTTTFAALAFGGSSMMIVVGVALETFRELEAQMSLRNYKGFLDD
jgi:preprotein translocase subunit SecY